MSSYVSHTGTLTQSASYFLVERMVRLCVCNYYPELSAHVDSIQECFLGLGLYKLESGTEGNSL